MSTDGLKNLLKRAKDEKAQKQTLFASTDLNHSFKTPVSSPFPASTVGPTHHEESPVTENSAVALFTPAVLSQNSPATKCREAPLLNEKTMPSSTIPDKDHLLERKRVRSSSPSSSLSSSSTERIQPVVCHHDNSSSAASMSTRAETTSALSTEDVRKERKGMEPLRKREKKEEEWHSREEINSFRKAAMKGLETTMSALTTSWERLPCGRNKKRDYRVFPSSMCPSRSKDAMHSVNGSVDDAKSKNQGSPALWSVLPQPVCQYLEELLEVEFRLPCLKYEEDMLRDNNPQERLFFVSRNTATTAPSVPEEELLLLALSNRSDPNNAEKQLTFAALDDQHRHEKSIEDDHKILRGGIMDNNEKERNALPLKDGNSGSGYSVGCSSLPFPASGHCARWRRCAALLQCMWFLLAAQWRDALRGKGLSLSFLSSPSTTVGGTCAKGQYGRSPLLVVDRVGDRIEGWSFVVYRFLQFQNDLHLQQGAGLHTGELSSSSEAFSSHPQILPAVEEKKRDEKDNQICMEELTSLPVRQAAEQWLEEKRWRQQAFRLLALVYHDFKKMEHEFLQRFKNTPPLLLPTNIAAEMSTSLHLSCATHHTVTIDTSTDLHTITNSSSDTPGRRHLGTSYSQESPTVAGKVCVSSSTRRSCSSSIEGYVVPASVLDGLYRILVVHLQKRSVELPTGYEEEEENKNAQEKEGNTTRLGCTSSSCLTTNRSITSLSHASSAPVAKNSLVALVTAARQTYNDLTLGNANWKLGLFSGGEVHMRRSMEKVERHHVSHLLNNEKALSLLHVVYLWIFFYEKGFSEKLRKSYCCE